MPLNSLVFKVKGQLGWCWVGGGQLRAQGSRRIREVLEDFLWTKSYERPYFKWRKDIVSRNEYFQWELAMPQRDYHPAWNVLACSQVLHKHHTFMPYYSPGREVEKKKKTFIESLLASSSVPRAFHQSSPYPYEAGLAVTTTFGKFWKLHHIPSKRLSTMACISVQLANVHSSSHWVMPHVYGPPPWTLSPCAIRHFQDISLTQSLPTSPSPVLGRGFPIIAVSVFNPTPDLW